LYYDSNTSGGHGVSESEVGSFTVSQIDEGDILAPSKANFWMMKLYLDMSLGSRIRMLFEDEVVDMKE